MSEALYTIILAYPLPSGEGGMRLACSNFLLVFKYLACLENGINYIFDYISSLTDSTHVLARKNFYFGNKLLYFVMFEKW
jgi:hypothetical protein